MSAVCPHVPYPAEEAVYVSRSRRPGEMTVRCPCCNAHAYRHPDDDLDGDLCPHCNVQAVPA